MLIGIRRKCFNRSFVGLLALALMLAVPACGGDDEPAVTETETEVETTATETETAETETETTESETETGEAAPTPTVEEPPDTATSTEPESKPGGAGDEEPARALALFTGNGGRIEPRRIRVPAFISIRVELRSADGREYGLTFRGKTIEAGGELGSVATTIAGLRAGAVVVGTPTSPGNRVRIEATAEPGP